MRKGQIIIRSLCALAFLIVVANAALAQGMKRVVVVKIDGLPVESIDKYVKQRDPETGKSMLPWFEEIFYKNGTVVPHFYTRGISLSGPAWGMIDTGQHMQVKGNVEFDRYTLQTYDYLRFFAFYLDNFLKKRADMPAAEVMDQLGIPLLVDAFAFDRRYHSPQLYQRDNHWLNVLGSGFINLFPRDRADFMDAYSMGFPFTRMTVYQNERDIIKKLHDNPEYDYFDYYDTQFDHVMHDNNDERSRLIELKALDLTLGRFWTSIRSSSRADETGIILLSDHGFNAKEPIYSQGFNLVDMLAASTGGGHHVMTKRRILLDYAVKGVNPLVPAIKTPSKNTYYLKGQANKYVTALVDFDGNERSSIHLRESGLNKLHILFQQLQANALSSQLRRAATNSFFQLLDERRAYWQQAVDELSEELVAVDRRIAALDADIAKMPKKFTEADKVKGIDKERRRLEGLASAERENAAAYRRYITTLKNLLSLRRETFDARKHKIEDLIAPGSMGRNNTVHELQNYIVGVKPSGLVAGGDGLIDDEKSFVRVNYFELLHSQSIRSNTQPGVSNRPIDFVAIRIPKHVIADKLGEDVATMDDAIWLHGSRDKQVLILSKTDADGGLSLRYVPIANLRQDAAGRFTFDRKEFAAGFPLKYFEDPDVAIPAEDRAAWLGEWHTELEWLRTVHRAFYSNAIIGLNEQLDRHPVADINESGLSNEERLMRRFRQRQRSLTESDMLILANNHWNFDIRGFNPGGNHGSFFRTSTQSTFMLAGGAETGIPRGLRIEQPYDSLSVMPTILRLMGKANANNEPAPELRKLGFRRFPGRVVSEVLNGSNKGH